MNKVNTAFVFKGKPFSPSNSSKQLKAQLLCHAAELLRLLLDAVGLNHCRDGFWDRKGASHFGGVLCSGISCWYCTSSSSATP